MMDDLFLGVNEIKFQTQPSVFTPETLATQCCKSSLVLSVPLNI